MKVTKSIIAVLVGLFAGSAYADCEYYLTGNKETLNISDCVDGVKDIANNALSNSQNAQNVANGAASTAQNAQTTANAANSAAQNAQNTANICGVEQPKGVSNFLVISPDSKMR